MKPLQVFTCALVLLDPTFNDCNTAAEATAEALQGVTDGLARLREAAPSACLAVNAAKKPGTACSTSSVPFMSLLDALSSKKRSGRRKYR